MVANKTAVGVGLNYRARSYVLTYYIQAVSDFPILADIGLRRGEGDVSVHESITKNGKCEGAQRSVAEKHMEECRE